MPVRAPSGTRFFFFAAMWTLLLVFYGSLALFSERTSYGEESDSFLCALSALTMARHAEYAPSRLPGFPLFERMLSCTADPTDARKSKLLIAAISALNILLLFFLLRRMNTPASASFLLCSTVALFPLYVRYSFVVIDYPLMIFFALAAALTFPSFERKTVAVVMRAFFAGIFISLAISTRLTSIFFVVALGAVVLFRKSATQQKLRSFIAFCAGTLAVAPLLYLDVYHLYGWHFLSTYPRDGTLPQRIIDNGRILVRFCGGLVGCAAIAAVLFPIARTVRFSSLLQAWRQVPAGALAFIGFTLINSLFYILKPDKISYHLPLAVAGAVVLAIFSVYLTQRRLLLLVAGIAIGNVTLLLPSPTFVVKAVPGPAVEEIRCQRKHLALYRTIQHIAGDTSVQSLLLSYPSVEKAPVWFFDSCTINVRVFHPTCRAYFWKSATDYRYPVYSCKNIFFASPLHLYSEQGRAAVDSMVLLRSITRVFIEGEGTEGPDSVKIADFFRGKCSVQRLPEPGI